MKEGEAKQTELFLKVVFKNEVFNFGKNIDSYQSLVNSAKLRFSSLKNPSFSFKQKPVTELNFNEIIKIQLEKGQKSMKVQLKDISLQKQVQKPSKSKKYSFNPNEFENEGESEKKKSLQQEFQVLEIHEKLEDHKDIIDPNQVNVKIAIQKKFQCIETQIETQYFWKCSLANFSQFDIKNQLYIKDLSTQKIIEVKDLKTKEMRQLTFGPYTEKQVGKHPHFYQIIFKKDESSQIPIGNKFGYICDTKKKMIIKGLQNKVYQRVNKVKAFCVCEKSTEYLVKMMKQLSINEVQIEAFSDQDLIGLIESIAMK